MSAENVLIFCPPILQSKYLRSYMGKGGGRGGVHPWVKKFFWSTPEVKKYGGAASLGWRRGSAAENFLTLPCNSRSKNGEKWTLPRVKWVPPPSKIGADSLKMAKVPRELAPQVKNLPAAEGGRQIFDIAPWELTPQVTFFACPCMVHINRLSSHATNKGEKGKISDFHESWPDLSTHGWG